MADVPSDSGIVTFFPLSVIFVSIAVNLRTKVYVRDKHDPSLCGEFYVLDDPVSSGAAFQMAKSGSLFVHDPTVTAYRACSLRRRACKSRPTLRCRIIFEAEPSPSQRLCLHAAGPWD